MEKSKALQEFMERAKRLNLPDPVPEFDFSAYANTQRQQQLSMLANQRNPLQNSYHNLNQSPYGLLGGYYSSIVDIFGESHYFNPR